MPPHQPRAFNPLHFLEKNLASINDLIKTNTSFELSPCHTPKSNPMKTTLTLASIKAVPCAAITADLIGSSSAQVLESIKKMILLAGE
jgi:hypothetical protein